LLANPEARERASRFFIVGPTAVGKSALAPAVAEARNGEIVNADAFQIYRALNVLTAKPDEETQRRVSHHLLGTADISEAMSAVKFRQLALIALENICGRNKRAIIVSGSGLYLKALTHGFDTVPPNAELRAAASMLSLDDLGARLQATDPQRAASIDLNNRRRVVRAIEIAESKTAAIPASPAPNACGIFLVRDRDDLYTRINQRVLAMFRDGVEAEVAALSDLGPTAAQALGLREIQQLIVGELSREECIATIQQKTRRYAKRQLTWFRHQTSFPQLNLTALSHREAVSAILQAIARE
jgi:tRNA dimethylallyltransferase